MLNEKKNFTYEWIMIVLCIIMIFITLGFGSSTLSLFVEVKSAELEIPRSIYSFVNTFRFLATSIINIFFGSLVLKLGTKKLVTLGFLALTLAYLCFLVKSLVLLYIGGILLGIGFAWVGTTMVGYVINMWCKKNKGTIMGTVLASNGVGGAIAVQIIEPIIRSAETGYRKAYLFIAMLMLTFLFLYLFLFRDKPTQREIEIENNLAELDGGKQKKKRGNDWEGITFNTVLKKPYFYIACVSIFLTGFVLQGVTGIAKQHYQVVGISSNIYTNIISLSLLYLTITKFLTGFMYDKLGLRITITFSSITAMVAMLVLSLVSSSSLGVSLAFVYSVLAAIALPLETVMLPIYALDLFGQKSYTKTLGIMVSCNTAGYALSSPFMNLFFDMNGSYVMGMYVAAGIMLVVIVMLQYVINQSNKERRMVAQLSKAQEE